MIFEEPDIERVINDYGEVIDLTDDLDLEGVAGEEDDNSSRVPGAQRWINTHPRRSNESEEEQRDQVEALLSRGRRRQVLWERQQAEIALHVAEEQAA